MIERNGERGSGISALAARHDDDDEIPEGTKSLIILKLFRFGFFA